MQPTLLKLFYDTVSFYEETAVLLYFMQDFTQGVWFASHRGHLMLFSFHEGTAFEKNPKEIAWPEFDMIPVPLQENLKMLLERQSLPSDVLLKVAGSFIPLCTTLTDRNLDTSLLTNEEVESISRKCSTICSSISFFRS